MQYDYRFINFFRALAAYWVLAAHCMIWGGWYGVPLPDAKMAVDLFMIISGYLMAASSYGRRLVEPLTSTRNWCRFWLRRLFRLAPAYYLSLALAIVLSTQFLGGYKFLQSLNPTFWPAGGVYDPARIDYSWTNILLHLTFVFGLHPSYSFSTFLPDWSLSLEMQFYIAFPAILLILQYFGMARASILLGVCSFIFGHVIVRHVNYFEPSLLIFKLNYFLAGIVLFNFLLEGRKLRKIVLAAATLGLVCLDWRYGKTLIILPILTGSMLILGWLEVKSNIRNPFQRFLDNRFVHFASDSSYAVYLFHGFFISASGLILSKYPSLTDASPKHRVFMMLIFVSICSYSLAWFIHKFVELPGIHAGRRVIERVAKRAEN